MKRRGFLGMVMGLMAAPFVARAALKPKATKWGYASVDAWPVVNGHVVRSGNIRVYVNGLPPPQDVNIVRAHDIEGWYESVERRTTREWARRDGRDPYAERESSRRWLQSISKPGAQIDLMPPEHFEWCLDCEEQRTIHVKADIRFEDRTQR